MANEMTVPLLPCASIDDIVAFYEVLGFQTTYRQRKPNPYEALAYRAEVAMVLHEPATAATMLDRIDRVALSTDETERATGALQGSADIAAALA
ncbi:hypothetical protein [Micromonospora sp. NPDC005413]|uniref:hypothetical protein n=1 Tax=Micromonospora sp. NPDC005413 TaxID=3154563 RepID=UPI0033B6A081